MLTPVYQDGRGQGVPGEGVGSERCKCNCGGFGYQTSMLYVMFPGWLGGGGVKNLGWIQDLKLGGEVKNSGHTKKELGST